jgi:hypothetical protein
LVSTSYRSCTHNKHTPFEWDMLFRLPSMCLYKPFVCSGRANVTQVRNSKLTRCLLEPLQHHDVLGYLFKGSVHRC